MEAPETHLLLHSMETFDFVFHLFIMSEIYLITNILPKYLQNSQICISQALNQVPVRLEGEDKTLNDSNIKDYYRINTYYA
ncbi:unnamed protein product [Rotaria sordida]|uniref:Uncharacterized protein n=1 Tax=Rotaria sordida TaxID=392033 RepID=A0A815FCM1_9BILA|nr:unnamed protein product [Rotaria sordida]CAF1480073.1 unnamed protein product [Rotaria sordida]CAF3651489.1 unnamed protein product [Rotaria sordida]CAF4178811.1 unnamed protein product [Rotaria sordida]